MKYLLTLLFGCMVISGYAQRKEGIPEDELPYTKYLNLLKVNQRMAYSYKANPDSSKHFYVLDSIYYMAKYEPYKYNKRKFALDVLYTVVALSSTGDTIMMQETHSMDSLIIPIVIKNTKNGYTRISVYVTSVKKGIYGKKSFLFMDKVGDVSISNTRDRYIVRGVRNKVQCNYRGNPISNWNPHGYNQNQIAVKIVPGVN